jgi:hypothetical protein
VNEIHFVAIFYEGKTIWTTGDVVVRHPHGVEARHRKVDPNARIGEPLIERWDPYCVAAGLTILIKSGRHLDRDISSPLSF